MGEDVIGVLGETGRVAVEEAKMEGSRIVVVDSDCGKHCNYSGSKPRGSRDRAHVIAAHLVSKGDEAGD